MATRIAFDANTEKNRFEGGRQMEAPWGQTERNNSMCSLLCIRIAQRIIDYYVQLFIE